MGHGIGQREYKTLTFHSSPKVRTKQVSQEKIRTGRACLQPLRLRRRQDYHSLDKFATGNFPHAEQQLRIKGAIPASDGV
jgi:hypothetical protein